MDRDLAALLETQSDVRDTAPGTTIVPRDLGIEKAIGLLEQMAGAPLLASIQLRSGAVIGEGGMGVVREAEQVALGRTVAIKTLKPAKRSAESAQALLREAWVTGSLEHPNVVPVHHLGLDDDGMPAIVLKRIEGVEWSKLIRDGEAVRRRYGATDLVAWNLSILMQVLNAIRFAHSRGILHRDLKPANVMVGDFGEVYLLDWGVAVSVRDDADGRLPLARDAKQIAGTPCYMAPEMLAPDGDVPLSERTDVYLAGAVLFEIVTGRAPHEGKTAIEVMTSVLTSTPRLPDDVPAELAAICTRAMARDAAERYATAEDVRLALQSYLEHRGSEHIVARARARLDELLAMLASSASDAGRREEIYRLFGACRFGFHEALAAWPGNVEAREGVMRATVAVAEFELAFGDAQSAVSILGELDDPPPLIERARAAAASQADRQRELERLRHAHDLDVGRRHRRNLGGSVGVVFTIVPLLLEAGVFDDYETHPSHIVWSVLFTLIIAVWSWLGRAQLTTTLVNRRLLGAMMFMFAAQGLMVACLWHLGVSIAHTQLLMLFLYFVCAGTIAMTVDTALLASAAGYGAAFVLTTYHQSAHHYALALGNFIFMINVLYAYRMPRQ